MDYSKLSDRDIDALVLQQIYGDQASDKDIMRSWLRGGFKYTTNAADSWPIIVDSQISIYAMGKSDARGKWGAEAPHPYDIYSFNDNPLRAAMLVFLMMQDEENGKD
ncbi:phage protein NinX family protein [Cronobacter sakazakii]|nr:DUF2591 family protein [Cronobacter sakazakii]EME1703206.1 DUF2591 family protein [Cronobacter sakazakii]